MTGALKMELLSLKRLRGEGFGRGSPSLATLEDMLRKSPVTDVSLSLSLYIYIYI
jgi:hypothetical protein